LLVVDRHLCIALQALRGQTSLSMQAFPDLRSALRSVGPTRPHSKRIAKAEDTLPEIFKADVTSKDRLFEILHEHPLEQLELTVPSLMELMADLQGVSRQAMSEMAMSAWFNHALGFPVLEVECQEQPIVEESSAGLLAFLVKLDARYDDELAQLQPGEDMAGHISKKLYGALPGDLADRQPKGEKDFDSMLQIQWTKPGSVTLGGVASMGLITLIVTTLICGTAYHSPCQERLCSCFFRKGQAPGRAYSQAMSELRSRGAEFDVAPDGRAIIRVPGAASTTRSISNCTLL